MKWLSLGIQTRSLEIMLTVCLVQGRRKRGMQAATVAFAMLCSCDWPTTTESPAWGCCSIHWLLLYCIPFYSVLFWVFFYAVQRSSIKLSSCSELGNVTATCHMLFAVSALTHKGTLTTPPNSPYHQVKEFVLGAFQVLHSNVQLCPCGKSQKIPSG